MFHFCFRWTKNVYLPLCKWCEVIKQCFPRSPVSAGCYLSKFSLFTVKKKKKFFLFCSKHIRNDNIIPNHISYCCCVCRTWCFITAVPLDISVTTKVPRAEKAALATSKLQSVHASAGRTHIGWIFFLFFFWRKEKYLKFARTKHRYFPWSLHAAHQVWMCGHAENRGGIHKCIFLVLFFFFTFIYPRKQKQRHQNSIFLLYSPQRAQWAQTPIQNSSKHSQCQSVLLNFQPECSSIFMCLLYENSTIWMMEYWSTSPCLLLQW